MLGGDLLSGSCARSSAAHPSATRTPAPCSPARRRAHRRLAPAGAWSTAGTARQCSLPRCCCQARVHAATPRCSSSASPSREARRATSEAPGRAAAHSARRLLRHLAHRSSIAFLAVVSAPLGPCERPLDRAGVHPHPEPLSDQLDQIAASAAPGRPSSRSRANATTSAVSLCARRGPGRAGTSAASPPSPAQRPPHKTTGVRTRTPLPRD